MSRRDDRMEEDERHPSYASAQFSRVQNSGRTQLFGSAISRHHSTIVLRISQASIGHHLGRDWIHAVGKEHIEVEFSSEQFAQLLTSLNYGSGVPCTLRRLQGERIPEPPSDEVEVQRVQQSFAEDLEDIVQFIKDSRAEATQILEKKNITKADRETLGKVLGKVQMEIEKNLPFLADAFQEATDRVVTSAKAEVDAFVTDIVTKTGINALKEMDSRSIEQLPPSEKKED